MRGVLLALLASLPALGSPLAKNVRRGAPAVFRLLPGGADGSLECDGRLQGSWGETVTFTRSGSWVCARTDGSLVTVGTNVPAVEAAGFKARAAVTNGTVRSEEVNAWTQDGSSVGADQAIAPNGLQTADLVTQDTATSPHRVFITATSTEAGLTYTWSAYVRAGTAPWVSVTTSGVGFAAPLNLQTGQLGTPKNGTSRAEPIAGGWYRLSLTFTAAATGGQTLQIHLGDTEAQVKDGVSYVGTGKTAYVWGAMSHAGAFPADYCGPTAGTAVTCNSDVASVSTAGWPASPGGVSLIYTPTQDGNAAASRFLLDSFSGSAADGAVLYVTTAGALRLDLYESNASSTTVSAGLTWTAGQPYRIAVRWGGGDAFVWRDDVLVASTSGTAKIPASHKAAAGVGVSALGGAPANGTISDFEVRR